MNEVNGWTCEKIVSGDSEILITTSVGPRVISLKYKGGENLFHVIQQDAGNENIDKYKHFGGHRLWTTPEDISWTYHVENSQVQKDEHGWFSSSPDSRGLLKSFRVQPVQGGFMVSHRLINQSQVDVTSSPWGITMLSPGGYGFFPDEPQRAHGSNSFLPVRSLSLWSYTKLHDTRLSFIPGHTKINHASGLGPFKLGAFVSPGWGGYFKQGLVFLKIFQGSKDSYPDLGSNFEIYTDDNLLETETPGTTRTLKPGDSVICSEIWQIFESEEANLIENCERRALELANLLS